MESTTTSGQWIRNVAAIAGRIAGVALSPWVLSTLVAIAICVGAAVTIAGLGFAEQYKYESAVYAAKQGEAEQLTEWRRDRRKRDRDDQDAAPEVEPDGKRIRIIKDKPRWFDGSRLKSMGEASIALAKGIIVLTLSGVGCVLAIALTIKLSFKILFSVIGDLFRGY